MSPIPNPRLIFNTIPTDYPEPGKTTVYDASSQSIDLDNVPLNGGALVKTLYLSADPYLRGRMRDPRTPSYLPAFVTGEPISGYGIGVVLRSENPALKPGDYIDGHESPFQAYYVRPAGVPTHVIDRSGVAAKLPLSLYIGILGMPGQTAFYGLEEVAKPVKGETIYISTAAGPVGATVAQLAKAAGLKVIGSAGSDEKVEFLKSIGVDVAFNYKKTPVAEVLQKEGPLDIYWDHVGGETLDAALLALKDRGRVAVVGAAASYNTPVPPTLKNGAQILIKALKIQGFLVFHHHEKYEQRFYKEVPALAAAGKVKWSEDVFEGLERAGHAIANVARGDNIGKVVIKVADP